MGASTLADIGQLLEANAGHTSASFQEFLQQRELTGRIVLALFGETPIEGKEPIYLQTLKRIISDLEEVRNAREWLKETRSSVRDRFKGIGVGTGSSRHHLVPHQKNTLPHGIRPSIVLGYRGNNTWSVRLEIPSFQNVATVNADIQTFLKSSRCRLNGADDYKPAGWLLSRNNKGVLRFWPNSQKPLIQFERSNKIIDDLLAAECQPALGPVWLFRISSDGIAREIASRVVRPGYDYIVVTTSELPEPRANISSCVIDCVGAKCFRLQTPTTISAEDTAWLDQLGLQVARTILVWPAGFPGRAWDGEGSCEWLTTEAPCIGMRHDHPVDAYVLSLNQGPEKVVEVDETEHSVFVKVSPLPAGVHTLTIKAQRNAALEEIVSTPAAEGFMHLHVREPEPWTFGAVSHPGLVVTPDPHDADLDAFARNKIRLSVLGPKSHSISLSISLESSNGEKILTPQLVANSVKLPMAPDSWTNCFARFLGKHEKYGEKFLEAASGQLIIKGGELGDCCLRFKRRTLALRWVQCCDNGSVVARLIDDTGHEETSPEILFLGMDHPLKLRRYPLEEALSGIKLELGGGLFYAGKADYHDAVVVSVTPKGLSGLGIDPDFSELRSGSIALSNCLRRYAYWHEARLYGLLAEMRWTQIVDGFLQIFYETLCGPNWANAEANFQNELGSQPALNLLQGAMGRHSTDFATALCREFELLVENENLTQVPQRYIELVAQHGVSADSKLCELALELACEAHKLPTTCGDELDGALTAVRSNPVLLRGARLLVLLYTSQNQDRGEPLWLPKSE